MTDGPTLRDNTGFWLALAGVLAVVGGIPAGIGAAATSAIHASLWSSAWFDLGIAIVLFAIAFSVWSLILFIAHSHAEKHWCPDPSAHVLSSQVHRRREFIVPESEISHEPLAPVPAIGARADQARDIEKMRSVLRSLRFDIRDSIQRIDNTINTGRYWASAGNDGGPLHNKTWKKNRDQLAGLAGMGDVYDSLYEAFAHIERINGFHFARVVRARAVKPGDRLDAALASLKIAEKELSAKLLALSA